MHLTIILYRYGFPQLYMLLCYQHLVSCSGSVTSSSNVTTVQVNNTAKMEWNVVSGDNQRISALECFTQGAFEVLIFGVLTPIVQPNGEKLFGERITATFNATGKSKYIVEIRNIQYENSITFRLRATFRKKTDDSLDGESHFVIRLNVIGNPGICGKSLKSSYNIIETASLTVTQDICGHPKPFVEWKLEETTFIGSSSSMLGNYAARKYRYNFTTPNMVRSHCGKKIMYNARNVLGNVKGNSTIYISFKPSKITLTSSYRYNASCLYLTWHREDTGNCLIEYHLKFDDKDDIYNTLKTNFNLCHSPCALNASVWASYKVNAGYKNNINLRLIPSQPDPTIMPSSRTTTEGKAAQSEDDCKCASKNAIGIVTTIVIGLILNIVLFVILKHKGFIVFNRNPKKTLQHTERRDYDNYEVTETTSSHYADLNVKSVKPSIYADLTTDSSKEYAEIELNETKQNMYANINT